ncbi:MAG: gas vesicle protein GvpG [Syntrophales bacterium]|nr:gas vesicle protein GvpG [Syntrophales bacterium]
MIPNASKYVPPVSQYILLVSAVSSRTLSRRLGVKQAWTEYRDISRRRGREPVEIGFLRFLGWLLTLPATLPFFPVRGIAWIAESLEHQASEEQDMERKLKDERLGLEMNLEMGEITEEEFKKRSEEIDRELEEIRGS